MLADPFVKDGKKQKNAVSAEKEANTKIWNIRRKPYNE
jgi:hypothetical protein